MATLKLRAIGNSVGEGDVLHVVETSDGFRLRRSDPEFERQMEEARSVMHRRRAVLRELAK
jgi:hypothetical protein